MIGRAAASGIQTPVFARVIDMLEAHDHPRPDLLRVLTYHRIVKEKEDSVFLSGLTVSLPVFLEHAEHLSRSYCVLHIQDLLNAVRTGSGLPPRSVLITFDDAYQDFASNAWPVLQHYALPATLFVPTAFPDRKERIFWWDWLSEAFRWTLRRDAMESSAGLLSLSTVEERLASYKLFRDHLKKLPHDQVLDMVEQICDQLGVARCGPAILGWDSLRDLARQGLSLGAHTRTHPLLNRISLAEARNEIRGSMADLHREIGKTYPIFAYPGGELQETAFWLMNQAGIELGFTTRRGINDFHKTDWLRIKRINIGRRTSLSILRAQLLARSQWIYRYF